MVKNTAEADKKPTPIKQTEQQTSYTVKSDVSKMFQNKCYMFQIVTCLLWKHAMLVFCKKSFGRNT